MNAPVGTFHFAPAIRERVSLLIALAGASGSGKTLSALRMARGLAGGDDSKVSVIDTEAGRAKHYAVARGEQPGPERFAFHHGDLQSPFTPEAYADAVRAADVAGFEVIVIDSCSHEYEGEGGLHDMHDELVAAAVEKSRIVAREKGWSFDELQAADRASVGAWKIPKSRHKRFVSRLLQSRAHLILCLRADEKIRIEKVKDERGRERTVIIQPKDMSPKDRWVPICEKRFMYEMTLSLVLTPQNPGIPIEVKLQQQHRDAVPLDRHLSEDTGRALAQWAAGGQPSPQVQPAHASVPAAGPAAPSASTTRVGGAADDSEAILASDGVLAEAAERGMECLQSAWEALQKSHRTALKAALDRRHKPRALEVDAAEVSA